MYRHAITSAAQPNRRSHTLSNDGPLTRESGETPAGLLATASAVLDADPHAAKMCIGRAAELLGLDLAAAAIPAQACSHARGGLAPWRANRLRAYIADNLTSDICAADLAATVKLSTSQFFRAFRETFGRTPWAYITQQRVRLAQELMLNSRRAIAEIALDCGMCDQSHFTRVFRRIVGFNPRAWRRQFAPASPSAAKE